MNDKNDGAASLVRSDALLADSSVIALIRLPVSGSTLVTLGPPLEEMAKRKGGEAMVRQEGEWLVISANAPVSGDGWTHLSTALFGLSTALFGLSNASREA